MSDDESGSGFDWNLLGRALIAFVWGLYFIFCCAALLVPQVFAAKNPDKLAGDFQQIGGFVGAFAWILIGYCMTRAVDRIIRSVFNL